MPLYFWYFQFCDDQECCVSSGDRSENETEDNEELISDAEEADSDDPYGLAGYDDEDENEGEKVPESVTHH